MPALPCPILISCIQPTLSGVIGDMFVSYTYFDYCKNDLLKSFSGKSTYSYTYYRHTMSGVLGQIRWPLCRRSELCGSDFVPVDPRVQQLKEAKEILAEVLRIDISEVDEMIRSRREERGMPDEKELCTEMLWVEP
jgi:hypothetical protein